MILLILATLTLFSALLLSRQVQELRRGAYYGGVTAGVYPSTKQVGVGEEFNLYLKINPKSGSDAYLVNGVNLTLTFNKEILELKDIEFDKIFTGPKRIAQANSEGKLEIIAVTTSDRSELHQDVFDLAKLAFKAKKEGRGTINREASYEIVGSRGQEGNIDRTLELTSFLPAEVVVEAAGDWPKLNFKIKFGGTSYQVSGEAVTVDDIPDQKVKVVVKKSDLRKEFKDVNVSFDDQAIGSGSVLLTGFAPGDGYAVLIKGPVHLSRRFCYDQQKEHCWIGEERIALVIGDNNYDWSQLDLEPGDINVDGLVDSTDFSMLKAAIGERGAGIKEDINFNGSVTGQDIVIFLDTLSAKYEEEI